MKANDIPKLYISADLLTKEDVIDYFTYINSIYESLGVDEEFDLNNE